MKVINKETHATYTVLFTERELKLVAHAVHDASFQTMNDYGFPMKDVTDMAYDLKDFRIGD
jgi:hypothetical protein